jgi:hypothetical protein
MHNGNSSSDGSIRDDFNPALPYSSSCHHNTRNTPYNNP